MFWYEKHLNKLKRKDIMNKQFYLSKTFWLNAITIGLGIVGVWTKTYPVDPELLIWINGIGNMLLRILDGKPISFRSVTFGK